MGSDTRPPPRGFVDTPYPYHTEVTLDIHDLTNTGFGVGRDGQWVVFAPFVLPGERAVVRIIRNHKSFSEGELVRVIRASEDRVQPKCQYFGKCGGCQYQHMSLDAQRQWKKKQVQDLFERIGGQAGVHVNDVCGTDNAYGYRAKLTPHYEAPTSSRPLPAIGFRRALSHQVEDVEECIIAMPQLNEKLQEVRDQLIGSFYAPTQTGKKRRGATLLLRACDKGVLTRHNDWAETAVDGLVFRYKAGEFFQNNDFVLPLLLKHVTEQITAGDGEITHVVDTYCGVGLFALSLARHTQVCAGIEINPAGVDAARANLKINLETIQQSNKDASCTFHQGTAAEIFDHVQSFPRSRTAVVIDPPRKGCDDEFIQQLLAFAPKRIVYVSCDPATQARDTAKILQQSTEGGEEQAILQTEGRARYRLTSVQPFDLFPQTRHIENVATFERIEEVDEAEGAKEETEEGFR